MDRNFTPLLRKTGFLVIALFLGWTAQAQSINNTPTDSTHHQYGMHHGHRPGGDSLARANGWHHGFGDSTHRSYGARGGFGPGGHQGFGPGGHQGFGPGEHGGRDGWASRGHEGREGFEGRHHGFQRGGHRGFGHRAEGVRYTPEQRKQLMVINKEYHQKSQDLYKQDNLTLKQYKAGLVALQKEKKDKMAALLTPQQKDQIAARKKRMDENRQVMQVAHLERLKLRLNLTDDQVAKIKAGQENLHSQVKAIHENDNLLPQQKREQTMALLAKRNDTYKAVLTPDQYSQFEKMHQRGFGKPGFGPGGPNGHRFGGPGAFQPGSRPGAPQGPGSADAI